NQEDIVRNLMKQEQKKAFVDRTSSLGNYTDAIKQHEKSLTKLERNKIGFENKLDRMLHPMQAKNTPEAEKQRILDSMKQLQKQYLGSKTIDARTYGLKQGIMIKQLSEIEKQISLEEVNQNLRIKGKLGFFWKIIYNKR
ncbi:MAG: hypothetical protein Q7K34_03495, partial [archaeon]|nr:hypothetical protein [archaeon]